MTELVACAACRRHVAARDIACRFCANPIVMLPDVKQLTTRTNARGEYALDGLPAGRYEVQYWPANQPHPRFGVSVTLDGRVGQLVDLPVYKIIDTLPATPYGAPPARRRIV